MNGYITPPPGLLPEAPSVDAPRREQVPAAPPYPAFTPNPLGAPPPAQVPPPPAAPSPSSALPTAETLVVRQPGAAASAASAASPHWSMELPDGTSLGLDGATFVGRNPVATDAAPGGTSLPLADPAKSLSKTHALLVPEGDYVMVTDLHSTNGAVAIDPSGAVTVLEPGRSAAVPSGSTLRLGDFALRLRRT